MDKTKILLILKYLRGILFFFGMPALVFIVAGIVFEDKTLNNELPGYAEYSQKTRYRLFSGIW